MLAAAFPGLPEFMPISCCFLYLILNKATTPLPKTAIEKLSAKHRNLDHSEFGYFLIKASVCLPFLAKNLFFGLMELPQLLSS
jgi:hypothetical protein